MFSVIRQKFKENPTLYYAFSIAATWAGVGSLMVGIQTAQNEGIVPFLLWAFGNTVACIIFGIVAPTFPHMRDVFCSKPMRVIIGLMFPFHIWYSMNGIKESFEVWSDKGTLLAYALAIAFIFVLLRFGMVRNVITDHISWVAVYAVATALTVAALWTSKGNMNILPLGMDATGIIAGIKKCVLLIPGPFLYPYFFEIVEYNQKNEDGTANINIRRAFTLGGLMFGAYLAFTFLLALANFSPALNIVKSILITLVAVSTLSSMQYGIYITFGKIAGLVINLTAVGLWHYLMPLGVMGAWSLMAGIRIYIVLFSILIALAWGIADKAKGVQA